MALALTTRLDRLDRRVGAHPGSVGSLSTAPPPSPPPPPVTPAALATLEANWERWLHALFPQYLADPTGAPVPFAPHHAAFWQWLWGLERGVRPRPFVGIWPRGGAKSTSAELGCVALGARRTRKYGLYVCETQAQADDHVGNIGGMLESPRVGRAYPDLATRRVGKYGASAGWRRNRLRTAAGFTIDAIGLDAAARGAKLDEDRPDFLVLDDLDSELDSTATTEKKITVLSRKLLPAGAADLAVLAIQNLVLTGGIFAQLADGRADFLRDRLVSGPHPALLGLATEPREGRAVIVAGTPTWAGQDVPRCQAMVDDMGLTAFLAECQHDVGAPAGGLFDHLQFAHIRPEDIPWGTLVSTVVWVDPAVTATDNSDANGLQVDALAADGTIYRLYSWEGRAPPEQTLIHALLKAVEYRATAVGVETDQGGETWMSVYREAWRTLVGAGLVPADARMPAFTAAKAGAGHGPKAHRAQQMLADYERGRFVHVLGTHATLERALRRFPKVKPFDLVDAAYWAWWSVGRHQPVDRTRVRPVFVSG